MEKEIVSEKFRERINSPVPADPPLRGDLARPGALINKQGRQVSYYRDVCQVIIFLIFGAQMGVGSMKVVFQLKNKIQCLRIFAKIFLEKHYLFAHSVERKTGLSIKIPPL